jgi:hypothetical protein
MLLRLYDLNLPLLFVAVLALTISIQKLSKSEEHLLLRGIIYFCLASLLTPMILPAFSSGMIWPWYFIPAFPCGIILMTFGVRLFWNQKHLSIFMIAIFLIGFKLALAFGTAIHSAEQHPGLSCKSDWNCISSTVRDSDLPENLTYFSFSPEGPPIKSRILNYYNLGLMVSNFWSDFHVLGFGPDPDEDLKAKYNSKPPDIIYTYPISDLRILRNILNRQGVNASWFQNEIRANYLCFKKPGDHLYIRREKITEFSAAGWNTCSVD